VVAAPRSEAIFNLNAGEMLQIAVGGDGGVGSIGGGSGGSFGPGNVPLVIAGGGGASFTTPLPGQAGLTSPAGGCGDPC
jgi:hypothetical protein